MASQSEPPLDEIQWRHPQSAQQMQGIHSNSVLFYFAQSPFFDPTSNNAVLANQAMFNPAMFHLIQTREAFEGRLRDMSGLEFIVAQEPAETAPGTGTGVWVIRKQTRRKRDPEDEIIVHATYYIVGENIYMAPTLAQVLSFRMATISSSLNKCFPAADEARTWTPSQGHIYKMSQATPNSRPRNAVESKETTPRPDETAAANKNTSTSQLKKPDAVLSSFDLVRHAEHSMLVHLQSGGDYENENPITGKPGAFNLSKTGRTDKLQVPGITALNTTFKSTSILDLGVKKAKDGNSKAGDKTPKTPTSGTSKLKRKKSKTGQTPTSS
ncbi:MED6 mediator sub complex component-domain-containing protein [Xylaria bambusicola]|uniref:MED6 mediator sub complex component-domain-containing protein n=1 Tax=Xylaria bambusicola TaxID=326684 RepID=UPI002007ED4D|nr:MED6 mediator sub complex component-domain-containing protein [Xylaria bambusicola]KAI0517661.1 MED6 mediator sub complex component-domain-containing protein [Xylaria bambusicola]